MEDTLGHLPRHSGCYGNAVVTALLVGLLALLLAALLDL